MSDPQKTARELLEKAEDATPEKWVASGNKVMAPLSTANENTFCRSLLLWAEEEQDALYIAAALRREKEKEAALREIMYRTGENSLVHGLAREALEDSGE